MASSSGSSMKGRPRCQVEREQLQHLRSLRFTWTEIAAILETSSKTIQRRAKEWNIETYSIISDHDLDEVILSILNQFPRYGEVMIRGHLHSQQVLLMSVLSCLHAFKLGIFFGFFRFLYKEAL